MVVHFIYVLSQKTELQTPSTEAILLRLFLDNDFLPFSPRKKTFLRSSLSLCLSLDRSFLVSLRKN